MSVVSSGTNVFVHGACATPAPLLDALCARQDLSDVRLYHLHTAGPAPFAARGREGIAAADAGAVRAVLDRLLGLVDLLPNRGAVVSAVDPDRIAEANANAEAAGVTGRAIGYAPVRSDSPTTCPPRIPPPASTTE